MTGEWTDNGVWGLKVSFPLWDWTEAEVREYLERTGPVRIDRFKVSLEGEGDLLGMVTAFCHYPADTECTAEKFRHQILASAALYVMADVVDGRLLHWIEDIEILVTVEVTPDKMSSALIDKFWRRPLLQRARIFVRCDEYVFIEEFRGFIKIKLNRVGSGRLEDAVRLANKFAIDDHDVLLMPDVESYVDVQSLGKAMVGVIDKLHSRVRLMPPVHDLLGMP